VTVIWVSGSPWTHDMNEMKTEIATWTHKNALANGGGVGFRAPVPAWQAASSRRGLSVRPIQTIS